MSPFHLVFGLLGRQGGNDKQFSSSTTYYLHSALALLYNPHQAGLNTPEGVGCTTIGRTIELSKIYHWDG